MKKILLILSLSAAAVISTSCYAQNTDNIANSGYTHWEWSASVGAASIDEKTAFEEGVDDAGISLDFEAHYHSNQWVTTLGLGGIFYDDNAKFEQSVVGSGSINRGDRSTESSSAQGFWLSAAFGRQWQLTNDVAATLQGGYAHMITSSRSIATCSNCFSEDIDVDAGPFVTAKIERNISSFAIGAYYKQYVGDGLSGNFGLTISTGF